MSMKNSNDTIGNRSRDLLVRSAVPQPTAPPAACPSVTIEAKTNSCPTHTANFQHTRTLAYQSEKIPSTKTNAECLLAKCFGLIAVRQHTCVKMCTEGDHNVIACKIGIPNVLVNERCRLETGLDVGDR
jgi:hypothetical protein